MADEARKDDDGKARFDLIPPRELIDLAELYALGAKKYGDRNWEGGLDTGRIFSAMMRHAWAWWEGQEHDPEDGQHHLTSVAWCALSLLWTIRNRPNKDTRPSPLTVRALSALRDEAQIR